MYSVSKLAAKVCRVQAGKFAEEATRDSNSFPLILSTDFQCNHANCRLQIAGSPLQPFADVFSGSLVLEELRSYNGVPPLLHAVVSMDLSILSFSE